MILLSWKSSSNFSSYLFKDFRSSRWVFNHLLLVSFLYQSLNSNKFNKRAQTFPTKFRWHQELGEHDFKNVVFRGLVALIGDLDVGDVLLSILHEFFPKALFNSRPPLKLKFQHIFRDKARSYLLMRLILIVLFLKEAPGTTLEVCFNSLAGTLKMVPDIKNDKKGNDCAYCWVGDNVSDGAWSMEDEPPKS